MTSITSEIEIVSARIDAINKELDTARKFLREVTLTTAELNRFLEAERKERKRIYTFHATRLQNSQAAAAAPTATTLGRHRAPEAPVEEKPQPSPAESALDSILERAQKIRLATSKAPTAKQPSESARVATISSSQPAAGRRTSSVGPTRRAPTSNIFSAPEEKKITPMSSIRSPTPAAPISHPPASSNPNSNLRSRLPVDRGSIPATPPLSSASATKGALPTANALPPPSPTQQPPLSSARSQPLSSRRASTPVQPPPDPTPPPPPPPPTCPPSAEYQKIAPLWARVQSFKSAQDEYKRAVKGAATSASFANLSDAFLTKLRRSVPNVGSPACDVVKDLYLLSAHKTLTSLNTFIDNLDVPSGLDGQELPQLFPTWYALNRIETDFRTASSKLQWLQDHESTATEHFEKCQGILNSCVEECSSLSEQQGLSQVMVAVDQDRSSAPSCNSLLSLWAPPSLPSRPDISDLFVPQYLKDPEKASRFLASKELTYANKEELSSLHSLRHDIQQSELDRFLESLLSAVLLPLLEAVAQSGRDQDFRVLWRLAHSILAHQGASLASFVPQS